MIFLKTIMVIDDDIYIGDMLEETLTQNGYGVTRAYSGTEALLALEKATPDLILLDLMLPGISGEQLLNKLHRIPVIVVSAKTDIDNKVDLLMNGASDYITKPFHTKELLARIAVQLRTKDENEETDILIFDNIILDGRAHTVTVNGEDVRLTRTQFAILKMLMQNRNQIVTKSRLLDKISLDTPDCTESSLKIHISNLRKKLRDAGAGDCIESVWGIGFKLKS